MFPLFCVRCVVLSSGMFFFFFFHFFVLVLCPIVLSFSSVVLCVLFC